MTRTVGLSHEDKIVAASQVISDTINKMNATARSTDIDDLTRLLKLKKQSDVISKQCTIATRLIEHYIIMHPKSEVQQS